MLEAMTAFEAQRPSGWLHCGEEDGQLMAGLRLPVHTCAGARQADCGCLDPTPSGRCDFRKAAGQVPRDSTSFAAPKLPFVTSRTRPSAAPRSFYNAAIQMTSELRNLSLSAFNPLGQHCSWSRDALGQGVVWVTPG